MGWTVDYSPILSWPLIGVIALVGAILIGLGVYMRARAWPLRALAFIVIIAALLNPTLRNEDRESLSDIAVAIVDQSRSQDFGNRKERAETALAALKDQVARLGNTELRVVTVSSRVSSEQDGTLLFGALDEALSDIPPERFAGAFLITDGQVHDVPEDPAKLGLSAPVHSLLTGSPDEIDRRIVIEQAPRFGIVGKEQTIRFRVEQSAAIDGPVAVTIRHGDGRTTGMEVLPGQSVELPVTVDHGGQNITELLAEPLAGEITEQNNRAIAVIEGIRDRLRVLLVSGEPHPGERTWRNLLKADASVDLVHFTILRPPEKQDGTPIKELSLIAFPTRELFVEKLEEFDLIIFDRYQRQGILPMTYLANIADYVRKGGAVLVAAGPDFAAEDGLYNTPLSAVLRTIPSGKVLEGPFRPKVTDRGIRHPVTRGLPGAGSTTAEPTWGRWFRLVDSQAEAGDVVMSGTSDKPLLVLSREGDGRIALLLSDHGWLWARGYEGGGPQTELLRRVAHWLMKEPDLEEEYLSARQDKDEIVIERRSMADTVAPVTITLPSGKAEEVALTQRSPGLWQGTVAVTEPGIHRLADGTLNAAVAIGSADPKEIAEPLATDTKLAPIAAASGGGMFWLEDFSGLPRLVKASPGRQMAGSGWMGLKQNDAHRVRAIHELPLFSTLLSLGLLLLGFATMWYREGR